MVEEFCKIYKKIFLPTKWSFQLIIPPQIHLHHPTSNTFYHNHHRKNLIPSVFLSWIWYCKIQNKIKTINFTFLSLITSSIFTEENIPMWMNPLIMESNRRVLTHNDPNVSTKNVISIFHPIIFGSSLAHMMS